MKSKRYVDDKIINSFIKLIEKKSMHNKQYMNGLAFNSLFSTDGIWTRPIMTSERLVRQNPFAYEFVFPPLQIVAKTIGAAGLWGLLVARPKHKDIMSFDSLRFEHNNRINRNIFPDRVIVTEETTRRSSDNSQHAKQVSPAKI